jgi:hypothetical protein
MRGRRRLVRCHAARCSCRRRRRRGESLGDAHPRLGRHRRRPRRGRVAGQASPAKLPPPRLLGHLSVQPVQAGRGLGATADQDVEPARPGALSERDERRAHQLGVADEASVHHAACLDGAGRAPAAAPGLPVDHHLQVHVQGQARAGAEEGRRQAAGHRRRLQPRAGAGADPGIGLQGLPLGGCGGGERHGGRDRKVVRRERSTARRGSGG